METIFEFSINPCVPLTALIKHNQIYPTELQLNKANYSDSEAPFLDLNL